MDFLQKLDFMMKKYSLNKRTLSQNSGIPYTTIDGWYKKGYEGMKISTLRILASYFNTVLDFWVQDDVDDPNYGKSAFSERILLTTSESEPTDVLTSVEQQYGSDAHKALSMYVQLDQDDKGEIRGEMKQMLKADKYKSSSCFKGKTATAV